MAEEFFYEDKSANFLICWMYFKDTFATQYFTRLIIFICFTFVNKILEYKSLLCFVEKSSLPVSVLILVSPPSPPFSPRSPVLFQ